MIREAGKNDLEQILALYLHLHEDQIPKRTAHLSAVWDEILNDKHHHLIVCETEGKIVSSCVCIIIPNLTRNVRPYALIENVVTHEDYRKKGFAASCLSYAQAIAQEHNCYKIMLLTGSKSEDTLRFYQNCGYNSSDKTAWIQWLGT